MIFKSDRVIAENIGDVEGIKFIEKGILSKRGIIQITTTRKKLEFSGPRNVMMAIYQEIQSYMGR